ncbi:hypothetical protein [Nocardia asteroides]|uniref:hypothetical protein n=1 Tax=Nocardia asteroides TaxID=1824 RepID=UPI001E554564|nr:hypothetical protein [Nocardia asteroides]UGT59248.1 hypothetical protein LTT61_18365 [Nocardia asteroides]
MSTDDAGSDKTTDEAGTGTGDGGVALGKSGAATSAAGEPGSSRLPLIAAFTAGILAVAAVTAVVVFWRQAEERGAELDAVAGAKSAACDFGRAVSEYDYAKDLGTYFQTVKDGATGDFLKEFSDAQQALTDAMTQAKVKSWTDDVQCGWQSGDDSSAQVLVTLTQYRTNFTQPTPDRQYVVVIADLEKSGDKWLVGKLDSPMLRGAGSGLPGGAGTPAPGGATPAPAPTPGG